MLQRGRFYALTGRNLFGETTDTNRSSSDSSQIRLKMKQCLISVVVITTIELRGGQPTLSKDKERDEEEGRVNLYKIYCKLQVCDTERMYKQRTSGSLAKVLRKKNQQGNSESKGITVRHED
ncbi:hypothetical protein PROFUN_03018 [Planoprotostelium fungivorum]|uniref:Uncharacterized protein n=1 Tax=Planoprotostelium fungivorum TaxID=1890364 RepID=A0A2P6NXD0_9EUKA|nr:hypothetical protein PROFUN_03018 [Planoprotostelium fungivorum]